MFPKGTINCSYYDCATICYNVIIKLYHCRSNLCKEQNRNQSGNYQTSFKLTFNLAAF